METKSLIEPNGFIDPRALAEAENPTCAKCGNHRGPTILARQRYANQHANYGRARKPSIVLSVLDTPTCTCAEPDFSYGEARAKELAQRESLRAEKLSGSGLLSGIFESLEDRGLDDKAKAYLGRTVASRPEDKASLFRQAVTGHDAYAPLRSAFSAFNGLAQLLLPSRITKLRDPANGLRQFCSERWQEFQAAPRPEPVAKEAP